MSPSADNNASAISGRAVVVSASRRYVFFSPDRHVVEQGTLGSKALDICVGDVVSWEQATHGYLVHEVLPRRNVISRALHSERRDLVANLDHLVIVAAVSPLFNTLFIDRLLAVASSQSIPTTLVVNKVDLGLGEDGPLIDLYRGLGFSVLLTAAKFGRGMEGLDALVNDPSVETIALVGVSGVGKSTVLNHYIPSAQRLVREVSERTGQGRQTTSQPCGFLRARGNLPGLLLIDLPGVQNFGVSHVTREEVAASFPEITAIQSQCEFDNCAHLLERQCVVKEAVAVGEIAPTRYESYKRMCQEIDEHREY